MMNYGRNAEGNGMNGFHGQCNHCAEWSHKAAHCQKRLTCRTCGELRHQSAECPKFLSEWEEGVWMGHGRDSNEAIFGTRARVRGHAIKRQWDEDVTKQFQDTPQQPRPL